MATSTKNRIIQDFEKQLSSLNEERTKSIFQLLHGKPMIHGLPLEVFRKCGKNNCKCAQGQLHGPYPALSVNKDGRQKTVMVRKKDSPTVLLKSIRYKHFQQTLSRIRKINKEIDIILSDIKSASTTMYPKE